MTFQLRRKDMQDASDVIMTKQKIQNLTFTVKLKGKKEREAERLKREQGETIIARKGSDHK